MIRRLLRIVLFCADTDASRRWYEGLGFAYSHGYDGMHWLRAGDTEIMLHPADPAARRNDADLHVQVDDVDALFRRALELGLEPFDHQQPGATLNEPVARPWGEREFELRDPDGYRWAFTQPA